MPLPGDATKMSPQGTVNSRGQRPRNEQRKLSDPEGSHSIESPRGFDNETPDCPFINNEPKYECLK